MRSERATRSFEATDRDRQWLRWIGRQRLCEVEQLGAQMWPVGRWAAGGQLGGRGEVHVDVIERRLRRMRAAGLVESHAMFNGRPQVWTTTRSGLDAAGLPLGLPKIDYRIYDHDLACGWLCLDLERDHRGPVLTEREIAALESDDAEPEFSAATPRIGPGKISRHRPDLALPDFDERGRPLAIELERTAKNPGRLLRLLGLYADARHLAGVRYYVTTDIAHNAIERANARLLSERPKARPVEIVRWQEPPTIPPPG